MRALGISVVIALTLAIVLGIALFTPLPWITNHLESDPWSVTDIEGSVSAGSASLSFTDPDHHRIALGRWHWRVLTAWDDLGWIEVNSAGPPIQGVFKVQYAGSEWRFSEIRAEARLAEFNGVVPLLDMVGLSGHLQMSSPLFIVKSDKLKGEIDVRLTGVRSSRVSHSPLGSYHGRGVFSDSGPYFIVSTDQGPLHIDGRGRFNLAGQWGFTGRAWLDAPAQRDLIDFLRSVGRLTEREELLINVPYPGR